MCAPTAGRPQVAALTTVAAAWANVRTAVALRSQAVADTAQSSQALTPPAIAVACRGRAYPGELPPLSRPSNKPCLAVLGRQKAPTGTHPPPLQRCMLPKRCHRQITEVRAGGT